MLVSGRVVPPKVLTQAARQSEITRSIFGDLKIVIGYNFHLQLKFLQNLPSDRIKGQKKKIMTN